ncbi:Acetyltransferase (GNAT) family protein [Pseudarcicella hirudinis]|uniref:Acetyltransferase (GNAT) family protein n=1 Tax=Pseudarcicella hirudinis TaxID=1079859 RepID=A0A1I5RPS7_9BACT|nr:GNAT family N-acetyltransferase [Pseudarcicella hirudinis]SFP60251.1 Acetyltransferase (GNAT) family protein [Pseudarcicella hirudinis]
MFLHYIQYSKEELEEVKAIFTAYSDFLGIDLRFQHFDTELETLHQVYGPPKGCIILAKTETQTAACIALKPIGEGICEMKRLFVKPEFRGRKLGKILVEELIDFARKAGYHSMKLDTLRSLGEAIKLYRSFGFTETEPYVFNPLEDVLFFELKL